MAKSVIKVDFTKGALNDTIERDVKAQMDGARATWGTMRAYVEHVAKGNMQPEHAKGLLLRINAKLAERRKAAHDPRPIAPLQDSRVSEMSSILKLGHWACWPTVFEYLKDLDVNRETLNTVSKFVRKNVTGEMKKNANAAPPREKIMREINKRKKSRRGTSASPNAPSTVRNPESNLAVIKRNARGLAKWFGKDGGKQFMEAIIKACESALPVAKKVAKQREAAAA